jgi:hypothetical protein
VKLDLDVRLAGEQRAGARISVSTCRYGILPMQRIDARQLAALVAGPDRPSTASALICSMSSPVITANYSMWSY